jgi:hypothetical protein
MRAVLSLLAAVMLLSAAAVGAQTAQPTDEPPAQPTEPAPVTLEAPSLDDAEATPTRSLTGVGAYAESGNVNIRSGPGVYFPVIGRLLQGRSLDVTSYNGYELSRECSPVFENDLDMWVEVRFAEQTGWVARCAVTLRGDLSRMLPNTAFPTPAG